MNSIGLLLDKAAIGLSSVCAIHCLMLPVALVLIPSISTMPFGDEHFHEMLIYLVVPASLVALALGCKKHQHWQVLAWGVAGLSVLIVAVLLGHDVLGEIAEKGVTLLGSALLIVGHVMNYRRCQALDCEH